MTQKVLWPQVFSLEIFSLDIPWKKNDEDSRAVLEESTHKVVKSPSLDAFKTKACIMLNHKL